MHLFDMTANEDKKHRSRAAAPYGISSIVSISAGIGLLLFAPYLFLSNKGMDFVAMVGFVFGSVGFLLTPVFACMSFYQKEKPVWPALIGLGLGVIFASLLVVSMHLQPSKG